MKKNEMGRECSMYGRQASCIQGFGLEICGKKNHLEGLRVDMMIILKRIFKTWDGTLSNEVMNLSVL
jgi:hypothetical protein